MIKLSSLCHKTIAVEFHDNLVHLKEPLCTISFRRLAQPKPNKTSITYGYVKDI